MADRDSTVTVTESTDYEIPDALGCDLSALPALAGAGWIEADREQGNECLIWRVDDPDRGVHLEVVDSITRGPLPQLPDHNSRHVKQRGERGRSGSGQTYIAGDFYLDLRMVDRSWTGMDWTGGTAQIRVRYRPEVPPRQTVVVDVLNVVETETDPEGNLSLGSEHANERVRVAVIESDESDESDETGD